MLAQYLARVRNEKGMPQSEASVALGIDQSYLSMIESGRRLPSRKLLEKIVAVYELDLSEIEKIASLSGMLQVKRLREVISENPTMGLVLQSVSESGVTVDQAKKMLAVLEG